MRVSGLPVLGLAMALLVAGCNSSSSSNVPDDQSPELSLTLLHINDHHSRLQPNTGADLRFNGQTTRVETGGFPRVVAKMRELSAGRDDVLQLHAGDAITGTLFYTLFKGEADAELMNEVCFDAFVLGNHEFDDSDAGLARFLSTLNAPGAPCRTPVISANVVPEIGTPLAPTAIDDFFEPYVIHDVAGQRVGIIGLTIANKTRNSSSPLRSTQFLDETTTAQRYIDELTGMGVNKIVLLTHLQYINDLRLAESLRGVDVIIGGDSHTLLGEAFADFGLNPQAPYPTLTIDLDGNSVCVAQAWQYSEVVGELKVNFDGRGRVTACEGTPHLLLGDTFQRAPESGGAREELSGAARQEVLDLIAATPELSIVTPDPVADAKLAVFATQVDVLKETVIGQVTEDLCIERIPGQGRSSLANPSCSATGTVPRGGDIPQLVTRAYRERSFEADVAIQNAGGVRVDVPAGPYTIGDAYTLLPFANTLVNLDLSGAEIRQVLEEAVDFAITPGGSTGAYPYASGVRWKVNLNAPFGGRLLDLEVKLKGANAWSPIDEGATYKVVTNSFIAAGRDGYLTFGKATEEGRTVDTFIDYAQGFIDYIEQDAGGVLSREPLDEYSTQAIYCVTAVGAINQEWCDRLPAF